MHSLNEKITCSEKEDTNVVDRTGIYKLEISMSFVNLLKICLQETTSYAASEHDELKRSTRVHSYYIGKVIEKSRTESHWSCRMGSRRY